MNSLYFYWLELGNPCRKGINNQHDPQLFKTIYEQVKDGRVLGFLQTDIEVLYDKLKEFSEVCS